VTNFIETNRRAWYNILIVHHLFVRGVKLLKVEQGTMTKNSISQFLQNLKYLIKGFVLVANVLPILSGFWLALYFTNTTFTDHWESFVYLAIGSTLFMSGALMLNNWYEVDLDREMERTQRRPTVTGAFSLQFVFYLGIGTSIIGFIFLLLTTIETAIYALLAWITYVVFYTFWTKRRFTLNTVVGSVSGAFTPLMGWAAITSANHIVPIVLFLILFIWQIPHTFAIAMRRYEEYKAAKVPMLPVVYGFEMTKRQNVVYVACLLPLTVLLSSISIIFVVVAMILNVIWLWIAFRGVFKDDNEKYADTMFYYSLLYLVIVFGGLIVITLPIFH